MNVEFTNEFYFASGKHMVKKESLKDIIKWNQLKLNDAIDKIESLKKSESVVVFNEIKQKVFANYTEGKRYLKDDSECLYSYQKELIQSQGFNKFFESVEKETEAKFKNIEEVFKEIAKLSNEVELAIVNQSSK